MKYLKRIVDAWQGNNDKERETPGTNRPLRRVIYLLWNFPEKIILMNLLFILVSIPIITIPAGLSAMSRYLMKLYKDGYGTSVADFWIEWKVQILRSLPVGVLFFLMGFYSYYLMSLSYNFVGEGAVVANSQTQGLLFGVGMAIAGITVIVASYTHIILGNFEIKAGAALKNAVILTIIEWRTSLGIVVIALISLAILLAFMPVSAIIYLIIGISNMQLCICAASFKSLQRRLIDPMEGSNNCQQ